MRSSWKLPSFTNLKSKSKQQLRLFSNSASRRSPIFAQFKSSLIKQSTKRFTASAVSGFSFFSMFSKGQTAEQIANEFIDKSRASVVIFSKTTCPYCKRLKTFLSDRKVPFVAMELDQHEKGPEVQSYLAQKTGQSTVPNVFICGNQIGGSDKTIELFKSGQADAVLAKCGIKADSENGNSSPTSKL